MNYSNIVGARNMYNVSQKLIGAKSSIVFNFGYLYLLPMFEIMGLYCCKINILNYNRNICQFNPMCYCEVAVDLFEISVEAKESIAWFKYMGTKNALIDLICQRSRVRIQLRSDYIES